MSKKHMRKLAIREPPHKQPYDDNSDDDDDLPLSIPILTRQRKVEIKCSVCTQDMFRGYFDSDKKYMCSHCELRSHAQKEIQQNIDDARMSIRIAKQIAHNYNLPLYGDIASIIGEYAV